MLLSSLSSTQRQPVLEFEWTPPWWITALVSSVTTSVDGRQRSYYYNSHDDVFAVFRVSFIPICVPFWVKAFLFLLLQSIFNVVVGIVVYYTIVNVNLDNKDDDNASPSEGKRITRRTITKNYIIGYGILCPLLAVAPIFLFGNLVEFQNVALMLCLAGAVPNLLLLRVVEAIHGLLPDFCYPSCQTDNQYHDTCTEPSRQDGDKNMDNIVGQDDQMTTCKVDHDNSGNKSPFYMLLVYYSAPLQFRFDPSTNQPVPLRRVVFWKKVRSFVVVLIQTSILFSILQPLDYQLVPEGRLQPKDHHRLHELTENQKSDHDNDSYIIWIGCLLDNIRRHCRPSHLINAYCMASLLSITLEGGASGLGLIFSFLSGLEMEDFSRSPMTRSTSVSDFWGRRWDRPVASALKRGAFRPLRIDGGFSRELAGLTVFALSGLIHEYVLLFMSLRRGNDYNYWTSPTKGRQALFFVFNGSLLVVERLLEGARLKSPVIDNVMTWFSNSVPRPVRTMFVILLVLPIGSWFTDEYIQTKFFDDSALGFPLVVIKRIDSKI